MFAQSLVPGLWQPVTHTHKHIHTQEKAYKKKVLLKISCKLLFYVIYTGRAILKIIKYFHMFTVGKRFRKILNA